MLKSLIPAAAVTIMLIAGCEDKKPATPAPKGTATNTPAAPAIPGLPADATKSAADLTADAREKASAALHASLDAAKAQLDDLGTKIKAAAADKKPQMQAAWDSLKGEYDVVAQKLVDLKNSPKWQELASEAKTKTEALTKSIGDTIARWKQ